MGDVMDKEIQARLLKNQIEIIWVLSSILKKLNPDLVGKNGALDLMLDDLRIAALETQKYL